MINIDEDIRNADWPKRMKREERFAPAISEYSQTLPSKQNHAIIPNSSSAKLVRTASIFALDPRAQHQGLLFSLHLDIGAAEALFIEDGEDPNLMHITLAYCGDADELGDLVLAKAIAAAADVVSHEVPLSGTAEGYGTFPASPSSDDMDVIYAKVNVPGLFALRAQLADALITAGASPRANFEYTPHITLAYVPVGTAEARIADLPKVRPVPLAFSAVYASISDEAVEIPLGEQN
jgi:2'-5' RNA ligase